MINYSVFSAADQSTSTAPHRPDASPRVAITMPHRTAYGAWQTGTGSRALALPGRDAPVPLFVSDPLCELSKNFSCRVTKIVNHAADKGLTTKHAKTEHEEMAETFVRSAARV
jgi:hypothetical protein